MAGPSPLHRPRTPVTMPCTTPCLSARLFTDTYALIAGYVTEPSAASTPAAHIIHVRLPKPYHMSCSISNTSPTIIVCLAPSDLIKNPRTTCTPILSTPTIAINIATWTTPKPITNFKYTNMHEYCPASGRYERNTATHNISTVRSAPTFRNAANGSACSQLIAGPQPLGLTFSGRLSGTATIMKKTSRIATAVAAATTSDSPYKSIR
ncbi:hypothetical protein SFRURICE_018533 [Spodoptera frugiperda]|nr:hypothetical protein SFRURICE_018533 [Spodoptera frugiperda]